MVYNAVVNPNIGLKEEREEAMGKKIIELAGWLFAVVICFALAVFLVVGMLVTIFVLLGAL